MDKHYEAVKEILEDQIKKIVKKGDITPQELDSLYKASAIVLDFETKEAMKKSEEQNHMQNGQSNNYPMNMSHRGSYDEGHSTHYPWFMYYGDGTYDTDNRRNSYGPVWNQDMENKSMHEVHSNDGMSNRRGVDGTGRNSYADTKRSYENAYDGAYDGAYDASNDNSYRRGRDERTGRYVSRDNRGYSRDKERMIGKLEDMMDDASSEKERRVLKQCVDKLERQ